MESRWSSIFRPFDGKDDAKYRDANEEKHHGSKGTIWGLFLIGLGLLNMLNAFLNLLITFFYIVVNPIQQRTLQYNHRIELPIQLIKLMYGLNDLKYLLIPFIQIQIQLLLLDIVWVILKVILKHFLSCQFQEGGPCGLFQMFSLLYEGPLLGTDLTSLLSQLCGKFVGYAFWGFFIYKGTLVVALGLELFGFLDLLQQFLALFYFLLLSVKVLLWHWRRIRKCAAIFAFIRFTLLR